MSYSTIRPRLVLATQTFPEEFTDMPKGRKVALGAVEGGKADRMAGIDGRSRT
ncbi:MAG: hypothetical protein ABSF26_27570 [Thermoguttaceae bacterium]